jgi:hypothetical protein
MQASVLLPLWRSGDIESLPHLLAEDATFSSPVTDYPGRASAVFAPIFNARGSRRAGARLSWREPATSQHSMSVAGLQSLAGW